MNVNKVDENPMLLRFKNPIFFFTNEKTLQMHLSKKKKNKKPTTKKQKPVWEEGR